MRLTILINAEMKKNKQKKTVIMFWLNIYLLSHIYLTEQLSRVSIIFAQFFDFSNHSDSTKVYQNIKTLVIWPQLRLAEYTTLR